MRWCGLKGQETRSGAACAFGGSRAERESRVWAEAAMRRSRDDSAAASDGGGGGGGGGGAGIWGGGICWG